MEIKTFKKQVDVDEFISSLNEKTFFKQLKPEKNLFRTTYQVLIYNVKDVETFMLTHFQAILEVLGIKDYQQKIYFFNNKIYVKFNGEDQDHFLLKKHRYLVSAIQNLLNNYIFQQFSKWYQVEINVNNHLHQQKYFLKKQVFHAIKELKATKKPFHFKPLPNDQRRIIHEIVKEIPDFRTYSEGKGFLRHIVLDFELKTNLNDQPEKE